MKKTAVKISCLIITLAMVLSLAACGNSSESAKTSEAPKVETKADAKKSVVKLWTLWSDQKSDDGNSKAFYKVMDSFKTAMPEITIEHDAVENESYKTKLKTAIAANEAPDIFYTWGAGFSKPFVDAGKVLAIDEYIKDGTKEKLLDGATTNFTYNQKLYGLPFGQWVAVLYCNKELFEKNGLKLPETYEDLVAAVKGFRAKGITPITVGEKERWPGMFFQNAFALRTAGAKACQDALGKQASFDSPEFAKSAALLKELVDLKAFNDGALGLTRDESQIPFLEGKIPMYYMGNWFTGDCEKEGSKVKGKIVAMKFPSLKDGNGNSDEYLGGSIEGFMVNAETKDKDSTLKVFKYLVENMAKESFANGAGLPCWKVDVADKSKINSLALSVAEQTKTAKGFVLAWDTFLEGADADAHKELVAEIFAGKKAPEQFAKDMQKLKEKK